MCRATIKSHGMQSTQTIFAESIELLGKVIGTRDGILYKILKKFLKKAKWKPKAGPGRARLPMLNKHLSLTERHSRLQAQVPMVKCSQEGPPVRRPWDPRSTKPQRYFWPRVPVNLAQTLSTPLSGSVAGDVHTVLSCCERAWELLIKLVNFRGWRHLLSVHGI